MKSILLKKLELTNFKGVAHKVAEFANGENFIYSANGTGKTTLFDAFTWVLFGRDSLGQADSKANIKTLDSNNKPIMGMDNTVEATFEVDGSTIALKRSYVEVWTKHAGDEKKTYEGQTTKYSWDGNEKISKTEYNNRVKELIDDGLFKLITDPNYFASLDVKERRKIILAMAGEITVEEIKFANPQLMNFDATKDVDEQKNVALSTKNRLIKDRDNYPARIDEQMQIISRKTQDVKEIDISLKEVLEKEKEDALHKLSLLEEKQSNITATFEVILKKDAQRIQQLKNIEDYKRTRQQEDNSLVDERNSSIRIAKQKYQDKLDQIEMVKVRINNGEVALNLKRTQLVDKKNYLKELEHTEIPDFSVETMCPTCRRELGPSSIEESKNSLTENWIKQQKEKIALCSSECEMLFAEGTKYKKAIEELSFELAELENDLVTLKPDSEKELEPYVDFDFTSDSVYKGMLDKLPDEVSIDEEIALQKAQIIEGKQKCREEISQIDEKLRIYSAIDILNNDIKVANERIEKLRQEELEVNKQIALQEKIIYLCDLWTRTKTEMLTRKVQSKFNLVKFKMFNFTKDGNAIPTCEIVVNGVDYVSLNTASKVNAGLDIINALIKYYDVKAPIFIDGRESVTNIDAPDTQIINLVVKEEN